MKKHISESGFTLIELSIVLVIIGLIIGGVVVGQDLIHAAQIRATVSQLEKYNATVNTFQLKYNCLPGDCPEAQAVQLGIYAMSGASPLGGFGYGDGNGFIQISANGFNLPEGESLAFFRHLSDANLIDGSFGLLLTTNGNSGGGLTSQYLPPAKLGNDNYILVGSANGQNYWVLTGISTVNMSVGDYAMQDYLTPLEAYNIDNKIDDGLPNTGQVQARCAEFDTNCTGVYPNNDPFFDLNANNAALWNTTLNCIIDTTPGTNPTATYNVNASSGGNAKACTLRIRWTQ